MMKLMRRPDKPGPVGAGINRQDAKRTKLDLSPFALGCFRVFKLGDLGVLAV
jgi:hypothetical protein